MDVCTRSQPTEDRRQPSRQHTPRTLDSLVVGRPGFFLHGNALVSALVLGLLMGAWVCRTVAVWGKYECAGVLMCKIHECIDASTSAFVDRARTRTAYSFLPQTHPHPASHSLHLLNCLRGKNQEKSATSQMNYELGVSTQ